MKTYNSPLDIKTSYDDTIPSADEPSTQFYIDVMRIYLGLYDGTISVEEAVQAAEILKENPEFVKYPVNPTLAPLNEEYKNKILSNLQTLKKFNLVTKDSVKSAFSFAFLTPDVPISETDLQVLKALENNPMCTLVDAADSVGVTSRTIARSIERLEKDLILRVSALMDMTSFGAQPFLLFFTLAEGIEWDMVEDGLARYPFTKGLLKTTMTDLGYASFLIPGPKDNHLAFSEHIRDISSLLFDYAQLHSQTSSGADSNIGLFENGNWRF
ncbi:MAG: winged helix-turn-helix transcriptional regulator, partial [Candidatus Thorarchaeota archaeon]